MADKPQQNLEVVSATPEMQKTALQQMNPKDLKVGIKQTLQDNIRSGVLDSDQLRTAAKNYVKQVVNNEILKKVIPPEKKSVSGFIKNFKDDAVEIVDGIGALLGMSGRAVSAPFKDVLSLPLKTLGFTEVPLLGGEVKTDRTVKGLNTFTDNSAKMITSPAYRNQVYQTYVKPIVEDYKEYRNPGEKLYNDPLGVLLDVSSILDFGASSAAKVSTKAADVAAKAAKAGEAAATAEKVASVAGKTSEVLDKAQLLKWSNISNGTKAVLNSIPGGNILIKSWQDAAEARGILNKNQTAFLVTRNRILADLDKKINSLSPDEAAILPKVVEGFSQAPGDASPAFYEALGTVKALADDQARFGLNTGALTNDIIERRKFQPLNNFLQTADTAEGKAFRELSDPSVPYTDLTGAQLRGRIDTIKKFFPDADPIYMRHFFDDNPKQFSSFFLNTKPVRTFKPGFLKKSYGKDGYIGSSAVTKDQLKDVLGRQATENLKWQRNIGLVDQLKNHPLTKPLKPGEQPLPGYKIFAPDGFLKFYRGTMQMEKELRKALAESGGDDITDLFGKAGEELFRKEKTYLGVTKAKLYQVPESFADELQKITRASNPYWKLFYDKPLDAFRFVSLSLYPRWLVNNIIGNIMFSTISGDIFNPKSFYLYKQAKQAGLLPDQLNAGLYRTERTTSGKLGAAAEIPLVRSTIMMHDALLNTNVVGKIVSNIEKTVNWGVVKPLTKIGNKSMAINEAYDDMFKGVAYINRALINERKGFLGRMATSLDESLKILEKTKLDEASAEKIVNDVHNWYYHGLNLTDVERRVIRRAIPFYSWMRWATLYAYRITTETPIRANIIANMARDFYTFTGQNEAPLNLRGSIPIGTDEDGTVYYLQTRGQNIFGHIANLMQGDGLLGGAFTTALQSSAPLIKTAAEQATGRDLFLDRTFTRKDVTEMANGRLWRFDPETGREEEVSGKVKPALTEHLLRNFIPQYLLLETALAGGQKRYTAEGLTEILSDLVKDPGERKAIIEDVITKQGDQKAKFGLEFYKALGLNIKEVTAEDRVMQQQAKEAATSALKNKAIPILNDDFKSNLKKKIMEEIAKGTPKDELKAKIKTWVVRAVTDLKMLEEQKKEPAQAQ